MRVASIKVVAVGSFVRLRDKGLSDRAHGELIEYSWVYILVILDRQSLYSLCPTSKLYIGYYSYVI